MEFPNEIKLNNGVEIPAVGLGTWLLSPPECEAAVARALQSGYRHIDTAAAYRNEEAVGKAVLESGLPRDQIFVTTKLWNTDHDDPKAAFERSLKRLRCDYIDLYLIHWPVEGVRLRTWGVFEKLYKAGRVRAIGVSNFTVAHLTELLAQCDVVPAVNQIEFHPFLFQKDVLEFCRSKNIAVESYSPLTRGARLNDKRIAQIAKKYQRSPAQILLRWGIQHGTVVLPKSAHKERIGENLAIFDFALEPADMATLDALNEDDRICWDPTGVR